ncbi:unnamed protein product [Mesocestoides corti]|uniref:ubiquitinyl hydrolase 1 n=1 Tax=Mesocestoides corti TaxID=53468 RepID=A0A158QV29_MESCO|nr:unnamed protein product [Mesocestoides corti]
MAEETAKWTCLRCTYANWPRSKRCTLCEAPRDLPSIEDEMHRVDLGNSKKATGGWSCPTCTFDNWAASVKCTQCGTSSPLPSVSRSSIEPESSSSLTQLGFVKWTCSSCTYENWPKSKTCVMCNAPPPEAAHSVSNPNDDWLSACKAVITGDDKALQSFLLSSASQGIIFSRRLTSQDCLVLDQFLNQSVISGATPSIKPGLSVIDLAQICHRTDLVSLFSALSPAAPRTPSTPASHSGRGTKRSFCHSSSYAAKELRRLLDACVGQRRGEFPCLYLTEFGVFALPAEMTSLASTVQEVVFAELCDTDVQDELEVRSKAINWWVLDGQHNQPTSRLFALWNRTDGDCLLDSIMQACWGVFDTQNTLRQALASSLKACERHFFRAWREYETQQAANQYRPDDQQLLRDWRSVLDAANLPRVSLEQIHIFVLAHILRRPIIVYSVKYIHNYRNEPIGFSNFQGVYLPVLWERSFCSRDPIILGYTRGHFSALVPKEPQINGQCDNLDNEARSARSDDGCWDPAPTSDPLDDQPRPNSDPGSLHDQPEVTGSSQPTNERSLYFPLFDLQGQPLPTPFASKKGTSGDTQLLRDRLSTVPTRRGLLLARLRLPAARHHLVETIVRDWLSVYQNMSVEAVNEIPGCGISATSPFA